MRGARTVATLGAIGSLIAAGTLVADATPPGAPNCSMFPADHIWHADVSALPVHARSAAWVASIGATTGFKADFGSGLWNGGPIGIPYNVVPGTQARSAVTFDYEDESDPGPYPIPANPLIEGGGDRHILMVDRDACDLWELYAASDNGNGTWSAGSGATWDLDGYGLRPAGWTSADAAGLPILPGLVRYDEVLAGRIDHPIRFTVSRTQRAYLWPARHYASSNTDPNVPPMGAWGRLRADFPEAGFAPEVQVIIRAMKTHGIILADNGANWYLSGAPDERWDNDILRQLAQVKGRDIQFVDVSGLMASPNSGQVRSGAPTTTTAVTTTTPRATTTTTRPTTTTTRATTTTTRPTTTTTRPTTTTTRPTTTTIRPPTTTRATPTTVPARAPRVTRIAPTMGRVGSYVAIYGSNLSSVTSVRFGGVTTSVRSRTATRLLVTVPAGARSGPVTLVWPGGSVLGPPFKVMA